VPQTTLRRWSEDRIHVWAYRLLVPHKNVPLWQRKGIKGLVCEDDLYTVFAGDAETDEFERFMTSIETPGQEAIEILREGFHYLTLLLALLILDDELFGLSRECGRSGVNQDKKRHTG
jgi:hypothetical protein